MQSKALTVDEYLKEVPNNRLSVLQKIRQLFLEELKGYDEVMLYGGPCYVKNSVAEAGFASQKHFIGVYIMKQDVMNKYKNELKGVSIGKGVIRFTNPDTINLDVVKKLVKGTYEMEDVICGHRKDT